MAGVAAAIPERPSRHRPRRRARGHDRLRRGQSASRRPIRATCRGGQLAETKGVSEIRPGLDRSSRAPRGIVSVRRRRGPHEGRPGPRPARRRRVQSRTIGLIRRCRLRIFFGYRSNGVSGTILLGQSIHDQREDVCTMAVSTITDDKKKALNLAITQIEKTCGKGSIMRLGTESKVRVEAIPTGAINLDAAIGIGGIPRGRITEIYGPESSGKTTLSLHVVANAPRAGGVAAYIAAEHALDTEYARKLGVDVDNLLISQPDTGEQALEIADILVRSGAVDVVVIDSVAALVPKAEIEGDMGDSHVGLQARLMSQALRKLTGAIARSKTSVIFIN